LKWISVLGDKEKRERRKHDPRSSLVEMESDEHNIRMKILFENYETARLQKQMAKRSLEYQEEEHRSKMKKFGNQDLD